MGPVDKVFSLLPMGANEANNAYDLIKEPMLDDVEARDKHDPPRHSWHQGEPKGVKRQRRRVACLLALVGLLSVALIGLLATRESRSGALWSAKRPARNAFVTSLYNDAYLNGTLLLGYNLDQHSTRSLDKVVLTIKGRLSSAAVCQLKNAGWALWEVDRIPPPKGDDSVYPNFKDQFTKLRIWQMEQYDHVLYVDSDCLIKGEMDSIFDLDVPFAVVPDVFEDQELKASFNAGVLYLRPNATLFERFTHLIGELDYPAAWAEQGFLNVHFKYTAHRLPYKWNANLATKCWPHDWEPLLKDASIVHFTLSKPMVPGKAIDRFKEENALWTNAWDRFTAERDDVFQGCLAPGSV